MGVAAQKLSQEDQGQSDLFRLDMMLKIKMPCIRFGHGIWKKAFEKYGLDIAPVWIRQVRNPGPHFQDRLFFFVNLGPPFLIPI